MPTSRAKPAPKIRAARLLRALQIIQKVRLAREVWRFVTVPRRGTRYVWDPRPGFYLIEWWEGPVRRREGAGRSPAEVLEAVRRKQLELAGRRLLIVQASLIHSVVLSSRYPT